MVIVICHCMPELLQSVNQPAHFACVCMGLFANKLLFVANYPSGMPGPRSLPVWRVNWLAKSCRNGTHLRTSTNAGISLVDQVGFISWKKLLHGYMLSLWSATSNTSCILVG